MSGHGAEGHQLYARFDSGATTSDGVTDRYDGYGELAFSTLKLGAFSKALSSSYDADGTWHYTAAESGAVDALAAGSHNRVTGWRSGRDSNPRYGFAVYSLSRRAPSTTRPPLRICLGRRPLSGDCFGSKVAARIGRPYLPRMTPAERLSGRMPTEAEIAAIARATLDRLPSPFAESLGDIVLLVEPVADVETARSVGLSHPMQLSGLYQGIPLNHQSVSQSGTLPERITLYSRPILAEWRSTRVGLEQLVSHIVIHEIGHHFGFSDDDMHALEDDAG